jgi:hypothetical protein
MREKWKKYKKLKKRIYLSEETEDFMSCNINGDESASDSEGN